MNIHLIQLLFKVIYVSLFVVKISPVNMHDKMNICLWIVCTQLVKLLQESAAANYDSEDDEDYNPNDDEEGSASNDEATKEEITKSSGQHQD